MTEELHHFLLLVEHLNFTRAARHAHLSQPSFSVSIQRLERFMGGRLFHRLPRGARLTAAGEALLPHARSCLGALEQGRRAVIAVQDLTAGEVRIAAGATACTYVLPTIIADFRKHHPGVKVHLRETFTPNVHEDVRTGRVDLGIAQSGAQALVHERWRSDPLVLVAASDLCLPARLTDLPLVAFTPGAALRALMDTHFAEHEVSMELSSIASLIGAVRAGLGAALLSRLAVAEHVRAGQLVEVPHPKTPLDRDLVLIHQGLDKLSPSVLAFRERLLACA